MNYVNITFATEDGRTMQDLLNLVNFETGISVVHAMELKEEEAKNVITTIVDDQLKRIADFAGAKDVKEIYIPE